MRAICSRASPARRAHGLILLCAHLDTVPLAAPVEVVRENGVLRNRHEAILGADNKAAVATVLGAARHLPRPARRWSRAAVQTCEERALHGAKAFDATRLEADCGFVFDPPSAVGELVVASPTYYRLAARFRGRAAHAGIRPEAGRNAIAAAARAVADIQVGRLDDETTANVGRIEGGTAANVVAERYGRARGAQPRRGRASEVVIAWSTPPPRPPATPSAIWRPRSSGCSAAIA